jgi:hypothetical protein
MKKNKEEVLTKFGDFYVSIGCPEMAKLKYLKA